MDIVSLDHIVLTVASIDTTVDWYERVLRLRHEQAGDRHALRFGTQKINLHAAEHPFEPKASRPTPGSADLCFVSVSDPDAIVEHLRTLGVTIEVGPVERSGALGTMTSVYVRDPDENLVEVAVYPTSASG